MLYFLVGVVVGGAVVAVVSPKVYAKVAGAIARARLKVGL